MRSIRGFLFWLGIVVVLGLLAIPKLKPLWAAESASEAGRGSSTPRVVIREVQPSEVNDRLVLNGTLLGGEEVELRPEMSGRVAELQLSEGSPVMEGDLLLKLDDRVLQAELEEVEAQLDLARSIKRRQEELYRRNAVAETAYDEAVSQVLVYESRKSLLEERIRRARIHAPFDGVLGLRTISPGAYVTDDDVVATLQQIDPMRLDFSLPERYQGRVSSGMQVQVRVAGFPESFEGTVAAREPRVDAATRTVRVRAKVPNPERLLLPGNFAEVELTLENFTGSILIPAVSVLRDLDTAYVFVVEDGKAVRRNVNVGIRTRESVQVLGGLKVGDSVVIRGVQSLRDGIAVEVVEGETEGSAL